jgi:hypothetical protein
VTSDRGTGVRCRGGFRVNFCLLINNFYEPALPAITTSCPPDFGAGLYRLSVGKHRLIWNPPLLGFRAGLYRLSVGKHRLIWNPPLLGFRAGLYRLSVGKHRLIWNPPLLGFRAGLYRLSVGKHRLIWNPPLHHWSL